MNNSPDRRTLRIWYTVSRASS